MQEKKVFFLVNIGATFYVHVLVAFEMFKRISGGESLMPNMVLVGVLLVMGGLYFSNYWFGYLRKLRTEWVLIAGLVYGVLLYKGGVDEGLFYAGIMMTSSFFIKNARPLILFELLSVLLVVGLPVTYSLSPLQLNIEQFDLISVVSIGVNFSIFLAGFWFFTYYQRVNQELIAAQAIKEEAAKIVERQRIAQEIHDSIGHSLVSMNMHLEYGLTLGENEHQKSFELLGKLKSMTEEAMHECQRAVNMLKENETQEVFSLTQSLVQLSNRVKLANGFQVEGIGVEMVLALPEYVQKLYFTTIREAVTNAIKYSGSKRLAYQFTRENGLFKLFICDFGKGAGAFTKSHGTTGIYERFEAIEGEVAMYDASDKGFCIEVKLSEEILNG